MRSTPKPPVTRRNLYFKRRLDKVFWTAMMMVGRFNDGVSRASILEELMLAELRAIADDDRISINIRNYIKECLGDPTDTEDDPRSPNQED